MRKILSELIVNHCSPVLAGLKAANLINCGVCAERLTEEILTLNGELNQYDIYIDILKNGVNNTLVYIYREKNVSKLLKRKNVRRFLKGFGYVSFSINKAIETLKKRMENTACFPHEIGIFLGYPYDDVMGFIENKGMNFKLCGCWKVYYNEEYARECFDRFRICTEEYKRQFFQGKTVKALVELSAEKKVCS